MDHARAKMSLFISLSFIFFLGSIFLYTHASTWASHTSLTHSLVQSIATIIAFFVGAAALYNFYSGQSSKYMLLYIGVGFIGTFIIDGYHTILTTSWFIQKFPNVPHTSIEWSWLSTRTFLAVLLFLSTIEFFRGKDNQVVNAKPIYITVGLLTVFILLVFMLVPVPLSIYPNQLIARPLELVPGVIFLITLIIYLYKGGWKTDKLEFWIVLFLIASVATQFFYIDLSKRPHDALYIGAHIMKIISYGMVYLGVTAKT